MDARAIVILQDQVLSTHHTIVVHTSDSADCIEVDGTILDQAHPLYHSLFRVLLDWEDHFEGLNFEDKMTHCLVDNLTDGRG